MDYNPDNNIQHPVDGKDVQNNNGTDFQNPSFTAQNPNINSPQNSYGSAQYTPSPSEIYNATAPGNAPQYHYGTNQSFFNPQYLEEHRQKMILRKHTEKQIRTLGTNTGITLLFVLAFSYVLSFFLILSNLRFLYNTDATFAGAFGIFYSAISVGGAFLIGSKLFKRSEPQISIPYNPPKDKTKSLLLIFMGFGGCLIANYITSFLRLLAEGIGIYSDYTALEEPSSLLDVIIIFIGSAIVPPLFEEFALRGVLMQNLRKHGDAFAIIASAFVFGLFHGNAVQMPFAFLCGLIIGYAVIATESLWTGIIIHGLINAMSAISSALLYYFDEYVSNTFFYIASVVGIAVGIIALLIYSARYKNYKLSNPDKNSVGLSLGEKFSKFISSPVMILVIIIYFIEAISQLTATSMS
ncbi:MAG: lysostaphin resistance A-like protein [Acutalibacteraceae bacterium]